MTDAEIATADLVAPAVESDTSSARRRTSWRACCSGFLRRNLLVVLLLLSLLLSLGVGFYIKFATELTFTAKELVYISFPGTLFLNMLNWEIQRLMEKSSKPRVMVETAQLIA